MSFHIAVFEVRYWLRSSMPWIFLVVMALIVFGLVGSDAAPADLGISNLHRNAPFAIETYYGSMGLFTLLMTAAFVASAALRDVSCNTEQIMFSTPLRRRDLFVGRFVGAGSVSLLPMFGVSLGFLAARLVSGAT